MFRLAICDDDTLHMQNTLRCARETPEAADCDIRTFSAPGELMDAVTGGGYVKCSKIVYRLCNHMVYSFDILKASQKKRKRWRWLGRKGLWK